MNCMRCGAINKDDSKFCIECGSPIFKGNPIENKPLNGYSAAKPTPILPPKYDTAKIVMQVMKILFVIFAAMFTLILLFVTPPFHVGSRDLLIYRANTFSFVLITMLLPGILILIPSLRKKIPLFRKGKVGYTILGWIILFFIGCISIPVYGAMHSPEYKSSEITYNSELALQREEASESKAQARSEAAASKAQAKSEAAASRVQAESAAVVSKAQAESDAAASKVQAESEVLASKAQAESEAAASKIQAESEASASKMQAESESVAENLSKIPKIGERIDVGDVSYVVEKVETSKTAGGEYLNTTAKGIYLIVTISITNNSNEALTISDSFFTIINGEKNYSADSTATLYASDDQSLWYDELNPDLTTSGVVVFDVSQNVVDSMDTQLQVQTGFWGTQIGIIRLIN